MLLHRSIGPSHVVHEHHGVGHLVQIHADRCLDVEVNADAATVAGFGYFQVTAQVGGDDVRSVWYPVKRTREEP